MSSFLPDDYELLNKKKNYINLSKYAEGDYKFRIIEKPICGWIQWQENKPFRYRHKDKPKKSFDEAKPLKEFWMIHVWDYSKEDLFIMDVSQLTVIYSIKSLGENEDWGDFTKYDIRIKKKIVADKTTYEVSPVPHKPIGDKIAQMVIEKPVKLQVLYEGGDPWAEVDDDSSSTTTLAMPEQKIIDRITEEEAQALELLMAEEGTEFTTNVRNWCKCEVRDFTNDQYEKVMTKIAKRREKK